MPQENKILKETQSKRTKQTRKFSENVDLINSTSAVVLHPEFNLYQKNNHIFCSSLQVAQEFGKRHDIVLRDIRALNCSQDFRLLNFVESYYQNEQNKKQPMYLMTKNGFIFLVMGYRGKKAAATRENIINNGYIR